MKLQEKDKEKVKEIIADLLGCDMEEVKDEAILTDHLGADSLDAVELIMKIEVAFDICIPDEDTEEIKIVSDYWPILERLV